MAHFTASAHAATAVPKWHCTQDHGEMSIKIDVENANPIYVTGSRADIVVWARRVIREATEGDEGDE